MLDGIRRTALPGSRTARATLLGVVAMAALIVGLLAMHASGSGPEHSVHAAATTAATDADEMHAVGHEASLGHTHDAPADPAGCALMMIGCVMLAAAGVLFVAAPRRLGAVTSPLELAVAHLVAVAPPRPPSLVALSISRT
ncbi:MAG TPA: hypothetical protein VGE78_10215 [Agromyces sp.]